MQNISISGSRRKLSPSHTHLASIMRGYIKRGLRMCRGWWLTSNFVFAIAFALPTSSLQSRYMGQALKEYSRHIGAAWVALPKASTTYCNPHSSNGKALPTVENGKSKALFIVTWSLVHPSVRILSHMSNTAHREALHLQSVLLKLIDCLTAFPSECIVYVISSICWTLCYCVKCISSPFPVSL